MSPHITSQQVLAELKNRLAVETDPLIKQLLEDKIKVVSQTLIRESVKISLSRERAQRSLAPIPVPIKCGLRNSTGAASPDKTENWYWSRESDKQARKLARVQRDLQELLFVTAPSRPLIQKLTLLGGLKKALKELGLGVILDLPAEVRKLKSQDVVRLIETKLNPDDKPPFC